MLSTIIFKMLLNFYLTFRSVLDFIHIVGVHLGSGFAKMTMANKLGSKIAWIAQKKVSYMFNINDVSYLL
jgi:hypothetical protein